MDDFKEFEGKSIDEAIESACDYFNSVRERLEIEILNDSKGGIFGLVGAKKAQVRARKVDSGEELKALVRDVADRLLSAIVPEPAFEVTVEDQGRALVEIKDDENSGLIIGREGQTLSSLQYLINRIVAKRRPHPVRVQLDIGDYRLRQDENLKQIALHLAEKVKTGGRPQSTKPLSSYHRRVVHLALQSDESVYTRSKGEGALKRVLILPKRDKGPRHKAEEADYAEG